MCRDSRRGVGMSDLPGSNDVSIVAGILVGGKSSRFGRPKALERLPNGKTLLEHVVETARSVATEVVLLGEVGDLTDATFHCRQLPDQPGAAGPLAGLSSLLAFAESHWALLLACDLPLLQTELLTPLVEAVGHDASIDVAVYGTGLAHRPFYTCCALYHPRLIPAVQEAMVRGDFRLQNVLHSARVQTIEPNPAQSRMLQDMNTPEDKSRLLD